MIFDDIAYVLKKSGKTNKRLCYLFNRERKAIFCYKKGMNVRLDYDFVCGLKSLGYEIALIDKNGKIVKDPEYSES